MKICTLCKTNKNESDFYSLSSSPDGLAWYCKSCQDKRRKKWARKNPKRDRETRRLWAKKSRPHRWMKVRAAEKRYAALHPDRRRDSCNKWTRKNRDKRHAIDARWRSRNRAKCALRQQQRRRVSGDLTLAQWLEILELFDGKCLRCGTKKRISIDHIIPIAKGGLHTASNVQPLCCSCNSSKRTKIIDYRPNKRKE